MKVVGEARLQFLPAFIPFLFGNNNNGGAEVLQRHPCIGVSGMQLLVYWSKMRKPRWDKEFSILKTAIVSFLFLQIIMTPAADVGVPCKYAGQVRIGLCAAASPASIELLLPISTVFKLTRSDLRCRPETEALSCRHRRSDSERNFTLIIF